MSRRVFKDERIDAELKSEGYVILDLLTTEDIAHLSNFYPQFSYCHQDEFSATTLTKEFESRKRIHDALSTVFRERMRSVLLNYKIVLASYAIKHPQTPYSRIAVHQDFTFVNDKLHIGLSIWCPLVEVTEHNGWLGVLRGSQDFNSNLRAPGPLPYSDLIDVIEEKYLTSLPMHPGQALFMDNRVFHGSPENRSGQQRLVAAGIAVPEEAQLLYCHHDVSADEHLLEVYEVPDDFFLRHIVGTRPCEGKRLANAPLIVSHLTENMIKARQAVPGPNLHFRQTISSNLH